MNKIEASLLVVITIVAVIVLTASDYDLSYRVDKLEKQRPPCSHVISDTTIYISEGKTDTMIVKRILH